MIGQPVVLFAQRSAPIIQEAWGFKLGTLICFTPVPVFSWWSAIASTNLPDWGQAAEIAFHAIFPQLVLVPEFTTH
ncbi:hypothetical protein [uncultured Nostoc sp.]|uniref:hypothetical protein n=1 Tax=uncultured Nostoc sp. TaxID=340711 RepID=UPI0035CC0D84